MSKVFLNHILTTDLNDECFTIDNFFMEQQKVEFDMLLVSPQPLCNSFEFNVLRLYHLMICTS